ncbi:nuclease-related domain-containing protein [Thiolinea disciformis]|uniref:nuclease-related domain-containing protein n=1 Tax=Thiolinea disciformis TaxID=125614 RepID=UPI00036D93C9|nr:nuclease-related domain-containing protein [Thiolinea disciformis]
MLIKSADDKAPSLASLEKFLTYPNLTDSQKKGIEQELRFIRAGLKVEKEVAYLIDFDFKDSKNYAVLHDLRLEVNGRVAQIDHLLINRTLDVFVLETKSFHAGLRINDNGEFLRWNDYKKSFEGMPSPIEQNQRHVKVLQDALEQIELPKRLGFRLMPKLIPLILISPNTRIDRPTKFDTHSVIKADTLKRYIMEFYDDSIGATFKNSLGTLSAAAKIVASDTVEDVARKLAALHSPIAMNYNAKFDIRESVQSGHVCRHCKSNHIAVLYGKYGYYFKCHGCSGNTAIKPQCDKDKCGARIRKEGDQFFRECAECKFSELYFTNPTTQLT